MRFNVKSLMKSSVQGGEYAEYAMREECETASAPELSLEHADLVLGEAELLDDVALALALRGELALREQQLLDRLAARRRICCAYMPQNSYN